MSRGAGPRRPGLLLGSGKLTAAGQVGDQWGVSCLEGGRAESWTCPRPGWSGHPEPCWAVPWALQPSRVTLPPGTEQEKERLPLSQLNMQGGVGRCRKVSVVFLI